MDQRWMYWKKGIKVELVYQDERRVMVSRTAFSMCVVAREQTVE